MDDANLISNSKEGLIELYAVGKKSEANEEDHIQLEYVTININRNIRGVSFLGIWLNNSASFRSHNILNTVIEDLVKKIFILCVGKVNDKGIYIFMEYSCNSNDWIPTSVHDADAHETYGNLRVFKNYWNELEKEFLDKGLNSLLNIDYRLNNFRGYKGYQVLEENFINGYYSNLEKDEIYIYTDAILELEILAIITALMVKEESKIHIYTDSLGVYQSLIY
ncbi:hypothetical protein C1646_750274 [Rhizophagus diaphanus]|nr:hypothetical protein C1646_750274 [Rhizophagus diaphanus] [Rhizophagus sp. MUCL 43196]